MKNMKFVSLVVLSLLVVSSATAQVDTGVLSGFVYDNSEAVIPGAKMTVLNTGTNYQLDLETAATGLYVSPPLPPGTYRITVTQEGFLTAAKDVVLHLSERLAVDFTLQIGAVTESVTVEAVGQVLQTEAATLSTLRTEREVKSLPINSRNFARLIRYTPGVVPGLQQAGGLGLSSARGETTNSVNGSHPNDNNFVVDGIQNNSNHQGGGVMNFVEMEAIEQFRVETSVPDARFGRSGASINIGYKSGTNEFHGTAFEFFRNDKLDARNYFARGDKAPLRQNIFGGTLGGPLGGNDAKTFFFLSYEGQRIGQGITHLTTVPTAPMKDGDFSDLLGRSKPVTIFDPLTSETNAAGKIVRQPFPDNMIPAARFDPAAKNVMDFYPLPNRPGLVSNFNPVSSQPTTSDQGTVKVDRAFQGGSRGFVRATIAQWDFVDTSRQRLGPEATPYIGISVPFVQIVPSYTHVISPRTINQIRFGFSRQPLKSTSLNGDRNISEEFGIPNSNVDKFSTGLAEIRVSGLNNIGDFQFRPAVIVSNNFQISDNLDATRGNHTFKIGFDVIRRQTNVFQASRPRGFFQFTSIYTNNPVKRENTGFGAAELLLGKPRTVDLKGIVGTRGLRRTDWGFYFQDDWKVTPKLTLNLGLRYEVPQSYPQVEVADRMMQFDIASGEPVPVGQGGISRSGLSGDWDGFAPRLGLAYRLTDATVVRAAYGVYYSLIPIHLGASLASNPPFFINSTLSNSQGDFEGAWAISDGVFRTSDPDARGQNRRGLAEDYETSYIQQWNVAVQQQLLGHQQLTVAYVGSKGTDLDQTPNLNQAVPGTGSVASRRRWPQHSSVGIRQARGNSTYHALQARLVKRYSMGLNYQVSYTWSHCISASPGSLPITDLRGEKGDCGTNIPSFFQSTFGYEFPFGRGKPLLGGVNAVANQIVGGWEIHGGLRLYEGLRFTPRARSNTLNIGQGSRADRLRDGNLPADQQTIRRWFDVDAFAEPGFRMWGNSGPNVLEGPGTKQLDLSIFKNFSISESKRLQFRAEFFNITNTPQFNTPNSTIGTGNAGRITRAGSEPTLQRTQRMIQLGLRFVF